MTAQKQRGKWSRTSKIAFTAAAVATVGLLGAVTEMDRRLAAENINLTRTEAVKLLVQGPPMVSAPFSTECLDYLRPDGTAVAGAGEKPADLNCFGLTHHAEQRANYRKLRQMAGLRTG